MELSLIQVNFGLSGITSISNASLTSIYFKSSEILFETTHLQLTKSKSFKLSFTFLENKWTNMHLKECSFIHNLPINRKVSVLIQHKNKVNHTNKWCSMKELTLKLLLYYYIYVNSTAKNFCVRNLISGYFEDLETDWRKHKTICYIGVKMFCVMIHIH